MAFRMPYRYPGQAAVLKRFVVIFHEAGHAICLKATSKVALYINNPAMMAGVVYYTAGRLSFFPVDTAIQPDNLHPIPHADIASCLQYGTFEILGKMPADFKQLLITAVNASITMKTARKATVIQRL